VVVAVAVVRAVTTIRCDPFKSKTWKTEEGPEHKFQLLGKIQLYQGKVAVMFHERLISLKFQIEKRNVAGACKIIFEEQRT